MPKVDPKIIGVSVVKDADGTVELRLDDPQTLALNDYVQWDFKAVGDAAKATAMATIDASISPFGSNPGYLINVIWVKGTSPDRYPCPALMVIRQNGKADDGKTLVPFTYGISACIDGKTPLTAVGKLDVPLPKPPARRKLRKKAPGSR